MTIEDRASAITTTFSNIKNNVVSSLAADLASNGTALNLVAGTGAVFPSAPFYVSVDYEVMWCTAKNGDTLQILRGVDGTTAVQHYTGSIVEIRNNAGLFEDAYAAIQEVDNAVSTGSTFPANVAFTDKVQELTHKTIDISDPTKGNVIIGNVQPDPNQLNYTNILDNGGFDFWATNPSLTLAAGGSTSGSRTAYLTNYWWANGVNDSSITVARDTTNPDPQGPSGNNILVNVNTVQANDTVSIYQILDYAELNSLMGVGISVSARAKLITGAVQIGFQLNYVDAAGTWHAINSPFQPVTSTYSTFTFQNQVWIPVINCQQALLYIMFKGVGQIALDNIMVAPSPGGTTFRPKPIRYVTSPNLLTNGGFEIWQRGNGPFTAGGWCSDRWFSNFNGTDTLSVSRDTANADVGSLYCATCTFVKGTGTTLFKLGQFFKSSDLTNLYGKVITFTARVKTSIPNTARLLIISYEPTTNNIYSTYHSGSGSYQTLTASCLVGSNSTEVDFGLCIDASATVSIDNTMVVVNQAPAAFIPLTPADDIARCLRYYELLSEANSNALFISGIATAASQSLRITFPYKTVKAVTPTVTRAGTWTVTNTGQPTLSTAAPSSVMMFITSNTVGEFYASNLGAGATITVEANP